MASALGRREAGGRLQGPSSATLAAVGDEQHERRQDRRDGGQGERDGRGVLELAALERQVVDVQVRGEVRRDNRRGDVVEDARLVNSAACR